MKIFTFWEPKDNMPAYLKLCMKTWEKFIPDAEIVVLDYSNISEYIDINLYDKQLFDGRFSLAQISDAIRAMLLEKHGGLWMDTDTIILDYGIEKYLNSDKQVTFFGDPFAKTVHIAWINAKKNAKLLREWVKYNKGKIINFKKPEKDFWAYLGNSFVNPYIKDNPQEVEIIDVVKENCTPEKKYKGNNPESYVEFYFKQNKISEIKSSMIMLHNSWTPKFFKDMSEEEFLHCDCTLSNILCEILNINVAKDKLPIDVMNNENRYILYKKDGSKVINPAISGLNVSFKGTGGLVEIYEPLHFEVSNIICGTNSHISIKGNNINQSIHGLNINAAAKGNSCIIGEDFSCWNIYITLIDEENLSVTIGDDCMFSSNVELRPSDAHTIIDKDTKKLLNPRENILIGNHVWIGKNVLICKGVHIPDNTVISAYSKVTGKKFYDQYNCIGGIPARVLKQNINWDRIHPDKWI